MRQQNKGAASNSGCQILVLTNKTQNKEDKALNLDMQKIN